MSDHRPEHDPGHLDIDAVSAFVDRDFEPFDLAAIEIHLARCPECHREVLEIRTTVFLLGGLPQYEPRRSFRLGHEHARASRRRAAASTTQAWLPPALTVGHQPGSSPLSRPDGGVPAKRVAVGGEGLRGGGWLASMQVAAMVVGALLLLVTVGDFRGFVPEASSSLPLAAPTAAAELQPQVIMPAPEAAHPETAADQSAIDGAQPPAPDAFETAFQQAPSASGGTESDESASEELPAAAEPAQPLARMAPTNAVAASVTQAIPTPGAVANAPAGEAIASKASAPAEPSSGGQASRLRIAQLALGVLLAWLVVSIAGLRWVRRLR